MGWVKETASLLFPFKGEAMTPVSRLACNHPLFWSCAFRLSLLFLQQSPACALHYSRAKDESIFFFCRCTFAGWKYFFFCLFCFVLFVVLFRLWFFGWVSFLGRLLFFNVSYAKKPPSWLPFCRHTKSKIFSVQLNTSLMLDYLMRQHCGSHAQWPLRKLHPPRLQREPLWWQKGYYYECYADTQVKLLLISGAFALSFLDSLGSMYAQVTSSPRSKD